MNSYLTHIFILATLIYSRHSQVNTATLNLKNVKTHSSEFSLSGSYNYARYNFLDVRLRHYHWINDGQTALAFAGAATGCEFSILEIDQIYIPYIGWQEQILESHQKLALVLLNY